MIPVSYRNVILRPNTSWNRYSGKITTKLHTLFDGQLLLQKFDWNCFAKALGLTPVTIYCTGGKNWIFTGLGHFLHKTAYYWSHKFVQSGMNCSKPVKIQNLLTGVVAYLAGQSIKFTMRRVWLEPSVQWHWTRCGTNRIDASVTVGRPIDWSGDRSSGGSGGGGAGDGTRLTTKLSRTWHNDRLSKTWYPVNMVVGAFTLMF